MADLYERFIADVAAASEPSERARFTQTIALEREVWDLKQLVKGIERSWSWRLTRPLRAARNLMGRIER
jgi:hypothetical protein